jgi:hypothetical protein
VNIFQKHNKYAYVGSIVYTSMSQVNSSQQSERGIGEVLTDKVKGAVKELTQSEEEKEIERKANLTTFEKIKEDIACVASDIQEGASQAAEGTKEFFVNLSQSAGDLEDARKANMSATEKIQEGASQASAGISQGAHEAASNAQERLSQASQSVADSDVGKGVQVTTSHVASNVKDSYNELTK